jgi:hypothetical protein
VSDATGRMFRSRWMWGLFHSEDGVLTEVVTTAKGFGTAAEENLKRSELLALRRRIIAVYLAARSFTDTVSSSLSSAAVPGLVRPCLSPWSHRSLPSWGLHDPPYLRREPHYPPTQSYLEGVHLFLMRRRHSFTLRTHRNPCATQTHLGDGCPRRLSSTITLGCYLLRPRSSSFLRWVSL